MNITPPTIFDRTDFFLALFDRMEGLCRRLDMEFPEFDGDAELSGADAIDRITEIRAVAKAILADINHLVV